MADHDTTIADLRLLVQRFVDQRDWRQFHNPKDLCVSLSIEAAELLEEYQWLSAEEVAQTAQDPEARARVSAELADVLIYAVSLANALDIDVASSVAQKLAANAQKYPADQYKGRFRRGG
jgi:dCTP diphosphatase